MNHTHTTHSFLICPVRTYDLTRHPSHAILHTSPQENSSELVELVAEGLEHAQSEVGGACLNQRMAVRSLCDGVSNLVAQEFDRELEQHQVSSYTPSPTNEGRGSSEEG